MTVEQYQQIYDITSNPAFDEVEKSAWLVCYVLGYTEQQVNNIKPARFLKQLKKAQRVIEAADKPIRWQRLNTDASKVTFGQFIEILHWLKGDVIMNLQLLAASITGGDKHKERAERILNSNIRNILHDTMAFITSLNQLILSYSGLFEIEDLEPGEKPTPPHKFIQNYGWIYSATQVAAHEVITLEQAFDLPVMQALNDLSYLKAKQNYDKKMSK